MARQGPARTDHGGLRRLPRCDGRGARRRGAPGEAAARAHAETMAEMWLRDDGTRRRPRRPAACSRRARRTRRWPTRSTRVAARPRRRVRRLVRRRRLRPGAASTGIVADAAPGSAGEADGWLAGRHGRARRPRARSCGGSAPGTVGVGCGPEFPVARAAARRVAPGDQSGLPETRAAAEALVESLLHARGRLLPAGAGAAARVGRRPVHRVAARALPAHPHRAADRARPRRPRRAARRAVRPDPAGAHPGAGRRPCRRWPSRRRQARDRAPSRGSWRCCWATAARWARRTSASSSGCCAAARRAGSRSCWSTCR